MILTVTCNPSIDRTIELAEPLQRGAVQRSRGVSDQMGGKGVNVASVIQKAKSPVHALVVADPDDPFCGLARKADLPLSSVPCHSPVRTNLTLTEPDGTTTKVNQPGPAIVGSILEELLGQVAELSANADWIALSGSIPEETRHDIYRLMVQRVPPQVRIAIDSSGRALAEALAASREADIIKPNGSELAELIGGEDPDKLESDPAAMARAARRVIGHGTKSVLATMGARGAVLVTEAGAWYAVSPSVAVLSTVGAGDSSLAGFLLAAEQGLSPAQALATAVAYGSAAAALPGSTPPGPGDVAALPKPDVVQL